MNDQTIHVLCIEDNPNDILIIRKYLAQSRNTTFHIKTADRLSAGIEQLTAEPAARFDVILLDLSLPDSPRHETLSRIQTLALHLPIVILSSTDDENLALQSVREGAQDYLVKGEITTQLLTRALRYAIERNRTEQALRETKGKLRQYADELQALYTIASTVATLMKPDELLAAVLDKVLPILDSRLGWVLLPGSTSDEPPHVAAQRGLDLLEQDQDVRESLKECVNCTALLTSGEAPSTPCLISDCPRLPPNFVKDTELLGHACIPLTSGQQVLGILNIGWQSTQEFTPTRQSLWQAIGQTVGIALQNAQLYQAARQLDRLHVLNEMDQALSATLDPDEVAEITLNQIAAALNASMGALFILPPYVNAPPERVFTLGKAWTKMMGPEDVEWLASFLKRFKHDEQIIPLPGEELAEFCTTGHCELADSWGPHGIAVPIWRENEIMAVLTLGGRPGHHTFTTEELALARAMANRAGQAIQNARLYRASQQHSARLISLNAISSAAVSSLELDEVLHQILVLTCQVLDAEEGSILLTDPDTGGLFFAVTSNEEAANLRGQRIAPGQGVAGWVVQQNQPTCVHNVRQDRRWYSGIDDITGFQTRSVCCAPLRHLGKTTGVIEIVNKRYGRFYKEDLNLLESVSSITAAALENARLYTDTRARADELAALNEIGLALTSTLDPTTVVRAALHQAKRMFHADQTFLLQPDPHTGELQAVQALIGGATIQLPVQMKQGEGIAGWVLEHRQAVLIDNVQRDSRYSSQTDTNLGETAQSLMAAPLLTPEYVNGVIEVVSQEPRIYSHADLRTLQALASTLAVALENARLYEESQTLLREREEAQAQLVQAEKMAALGRLGASVAHEINNPLQAVQGCLTLATEQLTQRDPSDSLQRYLDIATQETERVANIVRRMRDFYSPAGNQLHHVDLHAILESVLELTKEQLDHASITVKRDWSSDLPPIEVNADHLKQVFLDLTFNAIDAMPDGGTLSIATAPDQLNRDDTPAPAVRITFTDTGVGMPPEVVSRLFEPFFTTQQNKSGLGLSISYGIIQSHHGEITVESTENQGATFTILLPVKQT